MYNTDLPSRAELPSSSQLLRSTLLAILTAAALLITIVLPSEYAIDPLGVGQMLGLKKMGEIKMQLAKEAVTPSVATPNALISANAATSSAANEAAAKARTDKMIVTLEPGQATEVKMTMRKGDKVEYSWASQGGGVNFDTHGDKGDADKDFYFGYSKGKGANSDRGLIAATFDGHHGWFWRNRTDAVVTITLQTKGEYQLIKQMF